MIVFTENLLLSCTVTERRRESSNLSVTVEAHIVFRCRKRNKFLKRSLVSFELIPVIAVGTKIIAKAALKG